ncbi:PEP-CTERM sorting domain-containing protein [Denitromonas halophila]|nr:PEP-CTERM sorting domain-containing protein [Denitromonas halophila]
MKHPLSALTLAAGILAASSGASAAVMTTSLGNTAPGFNDGDTPALVPQILAAQSGQPAPFNAGLGNEVIGPSATGAWTFTYAPIADPIISATLDIGLVDHDSAAAGDQVLLFTVDGIDLTSNLNTLFNASGGGNNEYNVYQLDLLSLAGALADGSASIVLNLQGPGLQECLIFLPGCDPNNPVSATTFNGAHYIFSMLTIETREGMPPNPNDVPEPASLVLLGLGLSALAWRRRRNP